MVKNGIVFSPQDILFINLGIGFEWYRYCSHVLNILIVYLFDIMQIAGKYSTYYEGGHEGYSQHPSI